MSEIPLTVDAQGRGCNTCYRSVSCGVVSVGLALYGMYHMHVARSCFLFAVRYHRLRVLFDRRLFRMVSVGVRRGPDAVTRTGLVSKRPSCRTFRHNQGCSPDPPGSCTERTTNGGCRLVFIHSPYVRMFFVPPLVHPPLPGGTNRAPRLLRMSHPTLHVDSFYPTCRRTTNSMPFYRILGDWDEMGPVGDADVDGAETGKANQQVRQE